MSPARNGDSPLQRIIWTTRKLLSWDIMVYPHQNPGPEHAEAAHPKLKDTHIAEKAVALEERKVAMKLGWELAIAVVVVAAAILLLLLL